MVLPEPSRSLFRYQSLILSPASGVAHSDDLIYLFPDGELNEDEASVARTMVELWTNFATYGSVLCHLEVKMTPEVIPLIPF